MQPIRILQLSDTHLGQTPGYELLGMDTDHSMMQVLRLAESLSEPDIYLFSGDISNNGYAEAYDRLYWVLDGRSNVVWLPGNHDSVEAMQAACGGSWYRPRLDLGDWQLISLDSSVPHTPRGTLAQSQLDFLREHLDANPSKHTLVALHHHVLPVGCDWLDEQLLSNQAEFLELVSAYPQVKAVTSGHVHQARDVEYLGTRFLTSPSTCIQFAQHSADFLVSSEAPGLRWLELYPDGRIETGIQRVADVHFQIDLAAKGY